MWREGESAWYRGRELSALAESMVGMSLSGSSASCFFQRRREAAERRKEGERQLLMSLHFPLSRVREWAREGCSERNLSSSLHALQSWFRNVRIWLKMVDVRVGRVKVKDG